MPLRHDPSTNIRDLPSSGGVQEYIEAVSFLYYLQNQALINLEQVRDTLRDEDGNEASTRSCLENSVAPLTIVRYNAVAVRDHSRGLCTRDQ